MRKPRSADMINLVVQVPKALKADLERVCKETGLTVSQQTRFSLALWVKRMTGKPVDALSAAAGGALPPGKLKPWESVPVTLESLGPEPDQHNDPAAWAHWSAKQGDIMVAKLAKGEWPE